MTESTDVVQQFGGLPPLHHSLEDDIRICLAPCPPQGFFIFHPSVTMGLFQTIRQWARRIKRDAFTLWFAQRHPDTALLLKAFCLFIVAYALSPIDLIPDFIPILGYLDDAILLPGLIWLAVKCLPAHVLIECRQQAEAWIANSKARIRSVLGGVLIVSIWLALMWWAWTTWQGH